MPLFAAHKTLASDTRPAYSPESIATLWRPALPAFEQLKVAAMSATSDACSAVPVSVDRIDTPAQGYAVPHS